MVRAEGAAACPFCGSTEVYVEEYEHHPGAMRWRVLCAGCMAGIDTGIWQSMGQAVQDWNRRAERTCRDTDYDTKSITCSECGETTRNTLFWVDVDGGRTVNGHRPRFCSNCGAKVVDE